MYRVVLADDEKWSLYGLSQMICWADYQCEICGMAYDGLSALDLCRREKPDLLISDIRMPGMDGLELTRCIALEMPRTTVILITGYSDLKYAQQALRLGVFDFLLKQITPATWIRCCAAIRKICKRRPVRFPAASTSAFLMNRIPEALQTAWKICVCRFPFRRPAP